MEAIRRGSKKIWDSPSFLEEFCSHITKVPLDIIGSASHFIGALEHLLQRIGEGAVDAAIGQRVEPVVKQLHAALVGQLGFYRKLAALYQWNAEYHLSRSITEVSHAVEALPAGELLLIPVTIASGTVIIMFEGCDDGTVECVVVNPSPLTSNHRKTLLTASKMDTATNLDEGTLPVCVGNAKMMQNIAMKLCNVQRSRASSEALWLLLLSKVAPTDEVFYQNFLTWMTQRDFEGQVAEHITFAQYATPSKSSGATGMWKPLVHCLRHMLVSRAQLTREETKHVRFFIRQYFFPRVEQELAAAGKITLSQKKLVEAALGTLALAATRAPTTMSLALLDATRLTIDRIQHRLNNLPIKGSSRQDDEQPLLDMTSGWDHAQQPDMYALFDMFRRLDSVEGFVGTTVEQAKATPINFFRFPSSVTTINEATVAFADVVQLLLRVSAHHHLIAVRNAPFLVVAAIAHFVVEVLPAPLGVLTKLATGRRTLWDTPVTYAQQQHLLCKLEEVSYFFHWGYRSHYPHRDEDGVHMVVLGALAAIADNIVRTPATDLPSVVTQHINGVYPQQEGGGFSVSSGDFARQTELVSFTYPEALVTRAAILDYFDEQLRHFPAQNVVFKFEDGSKAKETALKKLVRAIAVAESFPPMGDDDLDYACEQLSGISSFIHRFYPEFRYWKNMVAMFKMTMSTGPGVREDTQHLANLNDFGTVDRNGQHLYFSIATNMHKELRYPSDSDPKGYVTVDKTSMITEDDLLHIQNLPEFGILGQRDVELLLSYLTTPYIRIPLVLRFFATEDRVSALLDETLCVMLHGVLFEPGRFLSILHVNECPQEVPTEQTHLIATTHGLLTNELVNSPEGVIEPLLKLLHLAKEMDAGTVFNESVTKVIHLLTRIVVHVESYLVTALRNPNAVKVHGEDRSFVLSDAHRAYLVKAHRDIRSVVTEELLPMYDSWIDELDNAISKEELSNLDPSTASSMLCGLYQHQVLLLRNVNWEEYDFDFVSRLLSAFAFLTTRFVWGRHVHFNEHEVYLVLQKHRRRIAQWLYSRSSEEVGLVMNSVVRVATGSGKRVDFSAANYPWGFVAGRGCSGRFTRADAESLAKKGAGEGKADLVDDIRTTLGDSVASHLNATTLTVQVGMHDVEISIHSGCLTFKAAFLKAIPQEIANDSDVRLLFEQTLRKTRVDPEAMQCAVVEEATNRTWVRLVGLEHDIQFWRTSDKRVPIPNESMRFFPDDCEATETWIAPIFEPYRRAFFQRSFFQPPILILLPEEKLSEDSNVASLTAVCSATGEKLKEIYVFRDVEAVHIYDIVSHGRRFYRQFVFYSDAATSLLELSDGGSGGDGAADRNCGASTSAVIIRRPTHPKNLSRSAETFIPHRFLRGLIPEALITTHVFWQDEDDNIRGYPTSDKETHLLWLHWKELRYAPLGGKSVGVQVFRFSVAAAAPRASEDAVLRSQRLELKDELEDEIAMMRVATTDSSSGEEAQLSAGMYRQSSVVHVAKPDSATIEDHNLLLLNLLFAARGTPLFSLACVLSRLEPLAHVLVWTCQTDYDTLGGGPATLDLIYLPRLKLSFRAKRTPAGDAYALFCLDHAHLFISNLRPGLVTEMVRGIPHSVIMADANDAVTILVPRFSVSRAEPNSAFSADVMVQRHTRPDWYADEDTKYYLYPVHISQCFLFTPSYGSAVYLVLLRYLTRNYAETFRLVASVGTDESVEYSSATALSAAAGAFDEHPDAIACMARLTLYVGNSRNVSLPWRRAELVAHHIRLQSRTTVSCLMPPDEERRLLQSICQDEQLADIVRKTMRENEEARRNNRSSRLRNEILRIAATEIREQHKVRVGQEKLEKLYTLAENAQLPPYFRCLLSNRLQLLNAESAMLESTEAPKEMVLRLEVPKLPTDTRPYLYDAYDPTSITTELPKTNFVNDNGAPMKCSPHHDYYYCGTAKREVPCTCAYACRDTCGGTNDDGCPCSSCERFNNERRRTIRLLPMGIEHRNAMRPLPLGEAKAMIVGMFAAIQRRDTLREKAKNSTFHSEQPTLRNPINGFFWLYEMITGTRSCKVGRRNIGRELTQLLLPFFTDGCDPASALSHLMHFIARLDKERLSQLPQFTKKARAVHISDILTSVVAVIAEDSANGVAYPRPPTLASLPRYKRQEDRVNNGYRTVRFVPRSVSRDASVPLANTRILPTPLDAECDFQLLALPAVSRLKLQGEESVLLRVDQAQLDDLSNWPLRTVASDRLVVKLSRQELGLPEISRELPFDLSRHSDAKMSVATDMLHRLEHEMQIFAERSNTAKQPKVVGVESEHMVRSKLLQAAERFSSGDASEHAALSDTRKSLQQLKDELLLLRKGDSAFVAYSNSAILRTANYYSHETFDGMLLLLRSVGGREPCIKLEYLLSALCSTTCIDEWLQLNPFLTRDVCEAMRDTLTISVLRANRAGHINRVLETLTELDGLLAIAQSVCQNPVKFSLQADALIANICQKADTLASQLLVRKCFFAEGTAGRSFDPRHLLFEFTWNLVMRHRQFELIGEMHSSIEKRGESVVKQMIMGAGKTTVVSPVLGMMLANGRRLIVQVVPPALLDFTRAVLRTTFSSILQKQIFTFICDRSTSIDGEVMLKFSEATKSRGIVVTTPSSVKSLFLKCIEGCRRLTEGGEQLEDRGSSYREAQDLLAVLSMWKDAVLVMDEVDMLLHPLKSELNFPIGPKAELDFTPIRWKLPVHLLDIIYFYHTQRLSTHLKDTPEASSILERFYACVAKGLKHNALQEMPHLILLNMTFYEAEMKPIVVDWLMLFIKSQHLVGLTDEETRSYLFRRPTRAQEPDMVARVEALDEYHIKVLNLAYEWMTSYLPHVLQKIDRVTFGIMTQTEYYQHSNCGESRSRLVTAIPFVGKDMPSPSSEFAHPDIVIGLTILAYRYEGLRETDFHVVMQEIFSAVEREVGRFSQRRTTILYNKWVAAAGGSLLTTYDYQAVREKFNEDLELGMQPSESFAQFHGSDDGVKKGRQLDYSDGRSGAFELTAQQRHVLPLKLMKQANEIEMKKLFKLFRRTPEVIHWYLTEQIFPEHMRHQETKLSASGQELGGSMLFRQRIGFSGTPSSLLPVELGQCGYEVGTDGQLIHTLTSPNIMSHTIVAPGWNVRSLLDFVASATPPFHALIDTGALITGMSNLQVAQYLLRCGLPHMEGVVYLDEDDRKMILVRATGRSLLLSECGISKVKRFTFYDQIHTTGMDVDHTPNAQAVQTLGKDMTFRDFSQGAYRMRGIGMGQTIHLLIIPEVYDLIQSIMYTVKSAAHPASQVLVGVTSWLLANSIRSEHTQHNQLRVQSCSNVWRKAAFQALVDLLGTYAGCGLSEDERRKAMLDLKTIVSVFDEPLDYSVVKHVPQPRYFSEMLVEHVGGHDAFITEQGRQVIHGIIDGARREDELEAPVIDVEMVQEQEEEREREEQKEEEHEIEIEKYIDLDYSRESESSIPWRFDSLKSLHTALHQFYPLREFHLFKRSPILTPDNIYLSRNYYSILWSGYRRIKNVIVTMEWTPNSAEVNETDAPSLDYGDLDKEESISALTRTLRILTAHQSTLAGAKVTKDLLKAFLKTALQFSAADAPEWDAVLDDCMSDMGSIELLAARVFDTLSSNALRHEQSGRNTVAVTLAEAETLRRILHFKRARNAPLLEGSNIELALHIVPSGNARLDESDGFPQPLTAYQRQKSFQCLRYFDGDLQYTDAEVGLLLRALQANTQGARKLFFHQTISCRRRARQRWERAPISIVFLLQSALILLHQRTVGLCMFKEVVDVHQLTLADAFVAFNNSGSGVLTAEEVWGAARFCRLELDAEDVLDFIDIADAQREGTVQYPDFLYMLSGSRDTGDDDSDEQQAKNLPNVPPHGGAELTAARNKRNLKQRMEEEASAQQLADEERRVMEEIEQENIRVEMDILRTFPNPKLETNALTFDFASESQVAQLTSTVLGTAARRRGDRVSYNVDSCVLCASSALRCSAKGLIKLLGEAECTPATQSISSFAFDVEFCLPKAASTDNPTKRDTQILQTAAIDLCQWQLPFHMYTRRNFRVPIERQIADELKSRNDKTAATTQDEHESSVAAEDDDDPNFLCMIFSSSVPSADAFVGWLPSTAATLFTMSSAKRQSVIVNDVTYEYGLLADARFPAGWICTRHAGESLVEALSASAQLYGDRLVLKSFTGEPPGPPYGRVLDSSVDPEKVARWDQWMHYFDDDEVHESSDDEEVLEDGEEEESFSKDDPRVHGDIEDLMIAIRRLRTLEKGDRVKRHPTHWRHNDDDGGEGSVGKVVTVGFDEVEVSWPNQTKFMCSWGKAGLFELIKVPKDASASQVQRRPENDDRHRELVEDDSKGKKNSNQRPPCEGCQERFPLVDMFICNDCPKPLYVCKHCFQDGVHDVHEFTELKVFSKEYINAQKEQQKKETEDVEQGSDSEELDEKMDMDLFGFGGEADALDKATDKEVKQAKAKEKPPRDYDIFPEKIVDDIPRDDTSFTAGRWVRSLVRFPPSIHYGQLGIVMAEGAKSHVVVNFLSDVVGDAKVTSRSVSQAELVPVKAYRDPKFGATLFQPADGLRTMLRLQFSPSLSVLVEAAAQRSTYDVGSCVVCESSDEANPFFAVVAMVLPNRKYMIVPYTVGRRMVVHESKLQLAYHRGAVVRFKRSVTYPTSGWGSLAVAHRYTTEFRVMNHVVNRSQRCVLSIEAPYGKGSAVRLECAPTDLEEAVEARWVIARPVTPTDPMSSSFRWDLLPNSCKIIIDRAFSEGKRFVRFTFSKKLYRVDFPGNVLHAEGHGAELESVQGTMYRFPRLQWSRPKRLLAMDDGAWHLLSLVIRDDSIKAMCDGEYIPVDVEGCLSDLVNRRRARDDLSIEGLRKSQTTKTKAKVSKKPAAANEDDGFDGLFLFGDDDDTAPQTYAPTKQPPGKTEDATAIQQMEDDDAEDNDAEDADADDDALQDGPTVAEMHALSLRRPFLVLQVAEVSSSYNWKLYTFPQRFITKCALRWGALTPESLRELHAAAIRQSMWQCTECKSMNPRHFLTCDECYVPRKVHSANRMLDPRPYRRFRYALLRSKEASQLRQKLGNKLRAMFQSQLDEIQNASGAAGDEGHLAELL